MGIKAVLSGAVVIAAFVAVNFAEAASFDCAKAAKPDEIAICETTALSDFDVQMATLFAVRMEIPMAMGSRGAARDEQRAFLAKRGVCGSDIACLKQVYSTRIGELEQTIQAAMQDYCAKVGICG